MKAEREVRYLDIVEVMVWKEEESKEEEGRAKFNIGKNKSMAQEADKWVKHKGTGK